MSNDGFNDDRPLLKGTTSDSAAPAALATAKRRSSLLASFCSLPSLPVLRLLLLLPAAAAARAVAAAAAAAAAGDE
jgi:hypothetical protein